MVRCLMVTLLMLCACGDPIENEIQNLVEGGEKAERAKMALNLAKAAAMDPLIAALQDQNHPVRARADLAVAVYRLYLREEDERLLQALVGALVPHSKNATINWGVFTTTTASRKRAWPSSTVWVLSPT